jgi:hypothetical protein
MNDHIKHQEAEIKTLKEINKLQCRDLDDAQRSLEDKHDENVRLKALLRDNLKWIKAGLAHNYSGYPDENPIYLKVKEALGDE